MNEFADLHCGQCRAARARQRHNDFISVTMENGDLLFEGLFVGGDYFTNDIDKDAPMLVGGVDRNGCRLGRHHEPQAHN